ncbi:MAG: alpha-amylase family glycosyl hydrolase [Bacteroidota bacterium]|nr:alpha-amylase family glycosyl hydrolase [Bacteroidota bacterium]
MRTAFLLLLLTLSSAPLAAQDSVDVTFRYATAENPTFVHLAGEFNNWADNNGGVINPGPRWTMDKQPDGSWEKTVRLEVGGGSGPDGAYQYKFNHDGKSDGWLADPLNPRIYGEFGNSIIHVRRPTVFHLRIENGPVLTSDSVRLRADIFPAVGHPIDAGGMVILLDGKAIAGFGAGYDPVTGRYARTLTGMADGNHVLTLTVGDGIGESSDSVRFTLLTAELQWLTRDHPGTHRAQAQLEGYIASAGVTDVMVLREGGDTVETTVVGERFFADADLVEGDNVFVARGVKDLQPVESIPRTIRRLVDHAPKPVIQFGFAGGNISLNAAASTDPDGDALSYRWRSEDDRNPAALNIDRDGGLITFAAPATPGEYYFTLEATDPAQNTGIARNFVRVPADGGNPTFGAINGNPSWVRDAVVYEIFVPAFSSDGDLRGVIEGLPRLRELGVNTLWLMPIMDNPGSINSFNAGYSIIDFYDVDESIGTLADYDELVDSVHAHGMRIILDITPNHVHEAHPWVEDIRRWGNYSIYRPFIETRLLGDDRGLGQSIVTEEGYPLYTRYSNWTLPNLNLSEPETRRAMMDVYRHWLVDRRADGFRLDVYWGPQNRYGNAMWWRGFRQDIKRYKPEVLLLGETDGTGFGSEINYADGGGALDAAYDWSWYGQIKSSLAAGDVDALHDRTKNFSPNENYNHYTGPNAHYFRFMENHDETRIAELFSSSTDRTKPGAAVMLTAPGIPMLYAGQEVGWKGRRNRIDFVVAPRPDFFDFYRELITLRSEYPALRSPRMTRVENGSPGVYSFLRPAMDENIITAASFRDRALTVTMTVDESALDLGAALESGRTYYMNDMLADSTFSVTRDELASFTVDLLPYQSRVLLLSDSAFFPLVTGVKEPPATAGAYRLFQNYPNPVPAGSASTLRYRLGDAPGSMHEVVAVVYDALGRELLRTPVLERAAGTHSQPLDTATLPAGQYLLRIVVRNLRRGTTWTDSTGLSVLR